METTYHTNTRKRRVAPGGGIGGTPAEVRAEREGQIADLLATFRRHRRGIEADEAHRRAGRDYVPHLRVVGYESALVRKAYGRFKAERAAEGDSRGSAAVRRLSAAVRPTTAGWLLAVALLFAGLSAASGPAGWSPAVTGWLSGMRLGLTIGSFCVFCVSERHAPNVGTQERS